MMVKVKVHREYYMDLSLTPGASAEDINKQSRKLGRSRPVDWLFEFC